MLFNLLVVLCFTQSPLSVAASTIATTITIPIARSTEHDTSRDIYAVMTHTLQGRNIPGYDGMVVRSLVDCILLCGDNVECMSFFYQSQSKTCYPHTIVYYSYNDTVRSEFTSYYTVGDADCPLSKGYVHKRNLNFCYLIVSDAANATNAARTCSETNGVIGSDINLDVYTHLIEVFDGSFILRKRNFWTGLEYNEDNGIFVFNSLNAPEFGRWAANEGTELEESTVQPDGEVGQCVDADRNNGRHWNVMGCNKKRAFFCVYQGYTFGPLK